MTSQPVARIHSMKSVIDLPGETRFKPGLFYRLVKDTRGLSGTDVVGVGAVVIRDQTFAVATVGLPLCVGDFIRTGPQTIVGLEFLIGGRVGLNKSTAVEIVNERAVADVGTGVYRAILKQVHLWLVADAKQLKQPLEIQTNGGVMGIKG